MKYVDEFRDSDAVKAQAKALSRICTRPWTIMEICGGQTHSIVRYGLDTLLPPGLELVHGPGCPVCVTPLEIIDQALSIAERPQVIFCTFGDMLRVPGSHKNLWTAKADGADVRILYSPLDAVKIAVENPSREVVFFAVGFETTAPAHAMAVLQAAKRGLENFSLLISHYLVPPAIETILGAADTRVQGFLAAGHVCAVMGYEDYRPLAEKYRTPIVVTGFEPLDLLQGIYLCVRQLEEGRFDVENQYARAVQEQGNVSARGILTEVFEIIPRKWRGIGEITASGLGLREPYRAMDAALRFAVNGLTTKENESCISGLIMQGKKKPHECPNFATICKPETPLGAPMVSNEGACAAYYRYRAHAPVTTGA